MDSKHRHELHENDLYEGITHAKDVWARYGNTVLIIVLVVAGFFAVSRLIRVTREQAHESRWSDLAMTTSPEAYRSIGQAASEPSLQALAYLRGADLLLTRAAVPGEVKPPIPTADGTTPAPAPAAPPSAQDRQRMIEDAALMYEQVLAIKGAHELYAMNARLGLANVAESRGDLEQARKLYEQVKTDSGERYSGIAAQATGRLAVLDRLARPVKFAPALPPAETSAIPSLLQAPAIPVEGSTAAPAVTAEPAPAAAPSPEATPAPAPAPANP